MIHYLEIIKYQVYANLKAESSRGCLGFLWWILEPVLYMSIFYVVFGVVLKRGGEGFVPFLLTGLTVWKWFHSSTYQGALSIVGGAGLMRQVYLPKQIFPLVIVFSNLFKFLIILTMLILFLLFSGYQVVPAWTALPILVCVQGLLIIAVASFSAAVIPFVRDLQKILENALTMGLFLSGVFFDIRTASPDIIFICKFNPMATLMINYRTVLLDGLWPNWWDIGTLTVVSLVGIFFAHRFISRVDRLIPKVVI